ncbi:MAG: PAS domain S-box protein [Maribacter sp.]|nr:PAS domain S-box protein [Maribacter sp.]
MLENHITLVRIYSNTLKVTQTTPQNYLIKQLPKAIVFVNKKFEVVYASDLWINTFELDNRTVFGKNLFSLSTTIGPNWQKAIKRCISGKPGVPVVENYSNSEQGNIWIEWTYVPWYDDNENIIGAIVQGDDISLRMRDEQQLKKLHILLNEKSEIGKIGSWEYDVLTNNISWSALTKTIHEVSKDYVPTIEEAIGFYKQGHDRNTISMCVENAIRKGIPWHEKLQIVTKNGKEKWVIAAGKAIIDDKQIVGLIGTLQDIDDNIRKEIKTNENERLLQTLIDNLPINIYIKDTESRKILANKSEADFVGLGNPEDLLGKTDFDIYSNETAIMSRNEDLEVMNTLQPLIGKTDTCIKKDGTKAFISVSKIPFLNDKNEIKGIIGMSLDITDKLLAQQELEEKERNFRSIFNSSYQFTGILAVDGTFIEVNDTALNFANLKSEDIIGKKFWDAYWWPVPDMIKDGLKEIIKAAAKGEVMRSEIVVLDYEKKPITVDFSLKPIYDENNQIVSLLAEGRMIIEMVAAREKLRDSEQKFRTLYELSPVSFILFDFETGEILDFNPSFEQTSGYNKESISKISYWDLLANQNKKFKDQINSALETQGNFGPVEETYIKKDGTEYSVIINKSLIVNKKGKKLVWTIVQDVSESVKKEIQIREERKLLKTVVDNLPLNVYIKDTESRKILVNKSECDYLGIKNQDELIGLSDFDLYDDDVAQISRDEDMKVMSTGQPMLGKETLSIKTDGSHTTFLTSKIPLKNENGEITGLVGISLDITGLKQKEEELRHLINMTSLQNKKLINFAHIVSHNLRSHTANFSMLLDFLMHEKDENEKVRIIKMLADASDNLLETLDNLNEVVAISTNVNLEKRRVNLREKIRTVEQNLKGFIINNNARIINTISNDVFLHVVPAYIDSILMNFLTNAVKYHAPERNPLIKLSAKCEGNYIVLSIEDNGLGIDLEKHGDKIFGMYKTFHNNKDARGIGLYITKNQIEAMNGKVTVQSKVNKGTTFNIYFNDKN